MFDFIVQGGVVLWVIMLLSVFGAVIVIERLLYFRRINVDEDKLYARIKASVIKGHYNEALSICDNNMSPLSALIKVGIDHREYTHALQKEVLKEAANQEIPRLEKI